MMKLSYVYTRYARLYKTIILHVSFPILTI